jgi:glycolate oxidase iron-sulfur subunit
VYLMRGAAEGQVSLAGLLAEEAELCLGCRACETACPSGVRYGAMLEDTRAAVARAGIGRGLARRIERWALRGIVPRRRLLRSLVTLLELAQRTGLDRVAARLLPRSLAAAHALLPPLPRAGQRRPLPELTHAEGQRRGCVAFFTGCVMAEVFAPIQRAGVRLLAANGFDVVVPRGHGCCGALHAHAGDFDFACELARRNQRVFDELYRTHDVDAIVVDSAGCGAAMRDAGRWLPDCGESFAARVRDICEFLDQVGMRAPRGRQELRVCYDDPCHLLHGQGVEAAPRRLLGQVAGLELVEHAHASRCCGAAGTYNLTQPEMSAAVLREKMDALAAADPDVIATGNPGCLMQLRSGARARGMKAAVVHPVELLDAACRTDS